MPDTENSDGSTKKIRDNPDLAKHEMDLEKVLKKPFQKDDLGRGELENPADFLRYIHSTSPELESILDRTPEEKKDEVQRALDELIQSELMERWKKETNDKQKELEKSVDTVFTIQESDIKNDDFHEKDLFTNALMQRAAALKEGLSEGMKQKIESYMASKIDEQHISWQTRHNIFHQQEITEGKNKINNALILSSSDIENDEFHDEEVFKQEMKRRADEATEDVPADLKNEMENHFNEKSAQLYREWKTQHETAEEKKISSELLRDIANGSIPPEMAQRHLEAGEFPKEYWNHVLENASGEIKADLQEHPALFDKIFQRNQDIKNALSRKFAVYEGEHDKSMEKKFSQEMTDKILSGDISDEMAETHLEDVEFSEKYFEEMLKNASPELREELGEHADLKKKLFENAKVQTGLKEKFEQYDEKHDKAVEKKFSGELKEGIDAAEISEQLAQEHLEPEEFRKRFFEEVLKNGSPELLEELREHDDLQEKLFKNQEIDEKLKEKYKEYDEKHDTAMEVKYSSELSELISSVEISEKMASQHLEPEAFQKRIFEEALKRASPELKEELSHHKELQEKLLGNSSVTNGLAAKYKEYEGKHDRFMETKFSGELETSLDAFWITPEMLKKPLSKEQFSAQVFSQLFKNSSPELQAELKEHKGLREKLMGHASMQPIMIKKYKKFQQLLKAKTSKEEESKDPQKKEKKEKVQLSAEDLEKNGERDLSKGLAKFIDMENGRSRLMELKKLPAIRKLFQNDTLKRSFSPFLTEWAAQLKSSEFKLFKLSIQKPDTTPEQMLQSMTGNLQRRKATQRIKKFSAATWTRFSQGLRQLHIAPTSLLTPNAFKPAENTEEPTEIENEPLEDLEALSEAELMEELEAENLEEEDEEGIFKDDIVEEETSDQDDELEEDSITREESEDFDDNELSEDNDESIEKDEDEELLETARDEDEMEEDESPDELTLEEKVEEDEKEMESEEDAVAIMDLEEGQEGLLQELTEEEQMEDDQETSAERNSDEEEDFSEENSTNPLSDEENDVSEFQENLEQQEKLPTEESVQEGSTETNEKPQDAQDQEEMIKIDGEPMSDAPDERSNEEDGAEMSESQFKKVEDISDDFEEIAQQTDHLEEETNQAEQKEIGLELAQDEESDEEELSEIPEEEREEENLQNTKKDEENEKSQSPIDEKKKKLSPTPEKKDGVPLVEKKEKRTDPLKELERFRKQLISRLRQDVKIPKTGIQHEFEALVGVPTESDEEERSEFLETLRLEMETYSMSLRTLVQKFVRYIRFVNDSEIPAFLQIPESLLDRLVIKPGEVFQQLNDFYFKCREKHEDFPQLIFSSAEKVVNGDKTFTLQFEVHKKSNGRTCRTSIPCHLVEEEERRVTQAG